MSKIKIAVACHKPSELPVDNPFYVPIHVGAALAKEPLPGMVGDNTGDNISEKNPYYCELTAQYWIWKNVDADYYGLCHYRRFLSFAPETFTNLTPDHRGHVLVPAIDDASKAKYHLEDVEGMREIIEGADIVAQQEQIVSKLSTPRGKKRTVYDHFAAHDHDLIEVKDLDKMIAIVREEYPQYADCLEEYLHGGLFRGFNCFVMKRDLFFEMCEYEFGVLEELEKTIDLSVYDTTLARVYGFMGEMLSSAFIYQKSKEEAVRVKDVQLLYFESTDRNVAIEPLPDAVQVVFNAVTSKPYLFAVAAQSFIESMNPAKRYDVVVLHSEEMTFEYRLLYKKMFEPFENTRLVFIDWSIKAAALEDSAYAGPVFRYAPQCGVAWVLERYDRIIMFDCNVLLSEGWERIADADLNGKLLAATPNIEWIGLNNNAYAERGDYTRDYLHIDNLTGCFSSVVMALDLAAIRERMSIDAVTELLGLFSKTLNEDEAANVLFEHSAEKLDCRDNYQVSNAERCKWIVSELPRDLAAEYKRAASCPFVVSYDPDDPFWPRPSAHVLKFWELARKTGLYEFLIEAMMAAHVQAGKSGRAESTGSRKAFEVLAPTGSYRREVMRKLMPWDSPVYIAARDAVNKLASLR